MAELQALGYVGRYAALANILAPWRQPRALLNARQVATVDVLKAECPDFAVMRRLLLRFRTILRHGKGSTLHDWMTEAPDSQIRPLQQFVRTLRRDRRSGRPLRSVE